MLVTQWEPFLAAHAGLTRDIRASNAHLAQKAHLDVDAVAHRERDTGRRVVGAEREGLVPVRIVGLAQHAGLVLAAERRQLDVRAQRGPQCRGLEIACLDHGHHERVGLPVT